MRTALHRFQISVFDNKIYYMTDCIGSFTKLLRPWSHGSRDRATPWKPLENVFHQTVGEWLLEVVG